MSIFKKKDKSPYRHIAKALVPPAAFVAVPDSPAPSPLPMKKSKVIVSPIVPMALFAHKTASAIAMGPSGIDEFELTYNQMKQTSPGEDEVYAQIMKKKTKRKKTESQFIDEERIIPAHSSSIRNQPQSYSPTHEQDAFGSYNKPPSSRGRSKARKKLLPREAEYPLQSPSPEDDYFTDEIPISSLSGSPKGIDDVAARQDALEEAMELRDSQNREIMLKLMRNQQESAIMHDVDGDVTPSLKRRSDQERAHDVAEYMKEHSFASAEEVVMKDNLQELVDENQVLKDTVYRLNSELGRYVGNTSPVRNFADTPRNGDVKKLMSDYHQLPPLFASYDRQLKERDEQIAAYEAKLGIIRKQVGSESPEKLGNLKEQNTLMVEEVQLLMEQLEMMQKQAKDLHVKHVDEVARLSKRLAFTDAELEQAEKDRKLLKEELTDLQEKFDKLKVESSEKIPARDHVAALTRCKTEIEDLNEQHIKELKELLIKLKEAHKEKSELSLKEAEQTAEIKQMEGELDAQKATRMKLTSEIEQLRSSLEAAERREMECQLHLANVIRVAERASCERDTIASVAEREQKSAHRALRQSMREKWELGKMEQTLKQCKVELATRNKDIDDRLREVEDTHVGHMREQELEKARLRKLLQQKQGDLDTMAKSKRQIEVELENVWQAAHNENRQMMEALHKSKIVF
uniref:Centrosomal protein of 89 kDa-like n=1 Tax=Phallusia mammillata TaxID=59560 RepID=A0A6F9D8X0_9ASCI|nr:centrosomal protein of 89 kDa-like [Phallusia mammillata]